MSDWLQIHWVKSGAPLVPCNVAGLPKTCSQPHFPESFQSTGFERLLVSTFSYQWGDWSAPVEWLAPHPDGARQASMKTLELLFESFIAHRPSLIVRSGVSPIALTTLPGLSSNHTLGFLLRTPKTLKTRQLLGKFPITVPPPPLLFPHSPPHAHMYKWWAHLITPFSVTLPTFFKIFC